MITFRIHASYKTKDAAGASPLEGEIVYPVTGSRTLDGMLGELYIYTVKSPVAHYTPMSRMTVEIFDPQDDGAVSPTGFIFYGVISDDEAKEEPLGSGLYSHTIHLQAQIRETDGIICQTLTFTNLLKKTYPASAVFPEDLGANLDDGNGYPQEYIGVEQFSSASNVKSPISEGTYSLPSLRYVGDWWIDRMVQSGFSPTGQLFKVTGGSVKTSVVVGQSTLLYNSIKVTKVSGSSSEVVLQTQVNTIDESPQIDISAVPDTSTVYTIDYVVPMDLVIGLAYAKYLHFRYTLNVSEYKSKQHPTVPYTLADVFDRVIDLCRPQIGAKEAPYTLKSSARETMAAITAPEFTMTQNTLHEQLKMIGAFFHAAPVLSGKEVDYVPYSHQITASIDSPNREGGRMRYTARTPFYSVQDFCDHVFTHAGNLVSTEADDRRGTVTEPGAERFITIRSETVGVTIGDNDESTLVTQYPIYTPVSLHVKLYAKDGTVSIEEQDITSYLVESTTYNSQLSSYRQSAGYSKAYALYYTQGEKNIGGLWFRIPEATGIPLLSRYAIVNILADVTGDSTVSVDNKITDFPQGLSFRLTYKAIFSVTMSHGKPDDFRETFAQIYNQSENTIELQSYGANLKGAAARLGNAQETRSYILRDRRDFPNPGEIIGGMNIASENFEFYPNHIKLTVNLCRNFNKISEYIGVNSIKRLYEVSERATAERNILVKEYIVIGQTGETGDTGTLLTNLSSVRQLLAGTGNAAEKDVISRQTVAVCYGTEQDSTKPLYDRCLVLPLTTAALGNAMVMSFGMADNFSAGVQVEKITGSGTDAVTKYVSDYVPYANLYGRMWWLCFGFFPSEALSQAGALETSMSYPELDNRAGFDAARNTAAVSTKTVRGIDHFLKVRKDSRERLSSITYEAEFKTTVPGLHIGSAFAGMNPLVYDPTERGVLGASVYISSFPVNDLFSENLSQIQNAEIVRDNLTSENVFAAADGSLTFSDIPAPSFCRSVIVAFSPYEGNADTYIGLNGDEVQYQRHLGGEVLFFINKDFNAGDNLFAGLKIYIKKGY